MALNKESILLYQGEQSIRGGYKTFDFQPFDFNMARMSGSNHSTTTKGNIPFITYKYAD